MILLDTSKTQEQADDVILQSIFERQCKVSLMAEGMAETLYRARSLWIGGGTIPWSELDAARKREYRREVEALITKARGEK